MAEKAICLCNPGTRPLKQYVITRSYSFSVKLNFKEFHSTFMVWLTLFSQKLKLNCTSHVFCTMLLPVESGDPLMSGHMAHCAEHAPAPPPWPALSSHLQTNLVLYLSCWAWPLLVVKLFSVNHAVCCAPCHVLCFMCHILYVMFYVSCFMYILSLIFRALCILFYVSCHVSFWSPLWWCRGGRWPYQQCRPRSQPWEAAHPDLEQEPEVWECDRHEMTWHVHRLVNLQHSLFV